jgi:outer membrane protein assembly factor BamA
MRHRLFRAFFIFILILSSFNAISLAQSKAVDSSDKGRGYVIRRVEFIGNETLDDKFVYKTIGLFPTKIYKPNEIENCINRLNKLGRFERVRKENVEITFNDQERFVDIAFHLKEKPNLETKTVPVASSDKGKGYVIRKLESVGNEATRHRVVMRAAGSEFLLGTPFNPAQVNKWVRGLNKLGRFERVTKENIELKFNDEERFVDITFHVKEKPNLKIRTK